MLLVCESASLAEPCSPCVFKSGFLSAFRGAFPQWLLLPALPRWRSGPAHPMPCPCRLPPLPHAHLSLSFRFYKVLCMYFLRAVLVFVAAGLFSSLGSRGCSPVATTRFWWRRLLLCSAGSRARGLWGFGSQN